MRPGQHAAGDGSFGRSSGMAAGRAAALLVLAVVLGIVVINGAEDVPGQRLTAGGTATTRTSVARTTTTVRRSTTTTTPVRQPKDVKVLPANGTTVAGAAGKVRDMLKAAGYNVLAPGQAKKADASAVYYTATYDREARAVADVLALPPPSVQSLPEPAPVTDLRGANILVVVGPDLAQRVTQRSTTSTTSRTGSTSRSSSTTSTTRKAST